MGDCIFAATPSKLSSGPVRREALPRCGLFRTAGEIAGEARSDAGLPGSSFAKRDGFETPVTARYIAIV
jgi:hypothetical protein